MSCMSGSGQAPCAEAPGTASSSMEMTIATPKAASGIQGDTPARVIVRMRMVHVRGQRDARPVSGLLDGSDRAAGVR